MSAEVEITPMSPCIHQLRDSAASEASSFSEPVRWLLTRSALPTQLPSERAALASSRCLNRVSMPVLLHALSKPDRSKPPLRILHFYKTYFPDSRGGVEQFIFQLARGSTRRGIDVDVLSLSSDVSTSTSSRDGHTVHRVRKSFEIASTGFSVAAFGSFAALARQADIVHYHHPWPFADMVHFATAVPKPTILTYHSDIVRQRRLLTLYKPLMKRFLGKVDRIV